jgi:hypothetical protein
MPTAGIYTADIPHQPSRLPEHATVPDRGLVASRRTRRACAADGVHEFLLVAAPLPVTGAVGAPVNPIAVK